VLQDWVDPVSWDELDETAGALPDDDRDWNKIGGAPRWLQGRQEPPGVGWHFAFQFVAGFVGEELADGAVCYGFTNDDGSGAFLWQCH
jgi:hypothetical protein